MPATVAIIGRPNVGKSTLFNRLLRKRKAITHDRPGVTRDRLEGQAVLAGVPVNLIDTGGLTLEDPQGLEVDVLEQARRAVEAADLVVLVVDGREGLTGEDERVAKLLRQSGKQVLLAVNKVDGGEKEALYTADFHALGLDMAPVSAEHGFGFRTLVDDIVARLPEIEEPEDGLETDLTFSMLGRPNAGKSSIINALLGESRLIVSDEAGTTRDAVDVSFEKDGKRYVFVDTAGVRRKTRIEDTLERIASLTALGSGRRSDVTVLVVDGPGGLAMQDKRLIAYLDKEKVPFLVAVNKIDLLDAQGVRDLKQAMSEELRICPHVPVLFVSATTGKGLRDILPTARAIRAECRIRVGTGELNRLLREAVERHQPPLVKGKRPKFYYLTQTDTIPATFVFFVNDPERIKASYARFLENQLRKLFGIRHAPVKMLFRGSRQKAEDGSLIERQKPAPQRPGKLKERAPRAGADRASAKGVAASEARGEGKGSARDEGKGAARDGGKGAARDGGKGAARDGGKGAARDGDKDASRKKTSTSDRDGATGALREEGAARDEVRRPARRGGRTAGGATGTGRRNPEEDGASSRREGGAGGQAPSGRASSGKAPSGRGRKPAASGSGPARSGEGGKRGGGSRSGKPTPSGRGRSGQSKGGRRSPKK